MVLIHIMNARQRLNEMLQRRCQPAAQFTYDKSGTDHFPTFVAHLKIGDREYVGESRGTKKLAAESCAAKVFEDNATADMLVDCRLPNWEELAGMHTGDATFVDETPRGEDDTISGPCVDALLIAAIHQHERLAEWDDDGEYATVTALVVYTGSQMVRDYVTAMNSGKIKGLGPFTIPVMLGNV